MSGLRNISGAKHNHQPESSQVDQANAPEQTYRTSTRESHREQAADHRKVFSMFQNAVANPFSHTSVATGNLGAVKKALDDYLKIPAVSAMLKLGTTSITANTITVTPEDTVVAAPSVCLVFSVPTTVDGKPCISAYVHGLVLVDNSTTPQALSLNDPYYSRDNIQDPTVWANVWDEVYMDNVGEEIRRSGIFDGQVVDLNDGGVTTIDISQFRFTNEVNGVSNPSNQLYALVVRAVSGLFSYMCTVLEVNTHTITPEVVGNLTLVAGIDVNAVTDVSFAGEPISRDWEISVQPQLSHSEQNRRTRTTLNNGSGGEDRPYGVIYGGFDFTLTTSEAQRRRIRDPYPEDLATFIPEFIIRGFRDQQTLLTLPLVMQLIGSVGMLNAGDAGIPYWVNAFNPTRVGGNTSRNLGALAMEVIDPQTNKPSPRVLLREGAIEDFEDLVRSTVIADQYRIGIDVATQGTDSKLLSTFSRAADYAVDRKYEAGRIANLDIIKAIDVLTGNKFSEVWGFNEPVMAAYATLVPGGYWIDNDGLRRDIRDIGYLALANHSDETMARELSADWLEAGTEPDEIRAINKRLELIRDLRGNNFVHCENYRRCYLDGEAYAVLVKCMEDAGVGVLIPNYNHRSRSQGRHRVDNVQGTIAVSSIGYRRHYSGRHGSNSGTSGVGGRNRRFDLGY